MDGCCNSYYNLFVLNMTTRIKGLVVTLDRDIREDDAATIKNAIMMIKGVVAIDSIDAEPGDMVTESRIKAKIRDELYKFIDEEL